jgi:Tol biopolymer transport system component
MNVRRLAALVVSAAVVAGPVAGAQAAKDDLVLVSRASGATGAAGDRNAYSRSISADGRYVAFESNADNLSSEDDDTVIDVYVRDLLTRTTTLVSRAKGVVGNGASYAPSMSADGRFVAFVSLATNLTGDDDVFQDVFVRDLESNTTAYVSRSATGGAADGKSGEPSISADGRYVAFESDADNMSTADQDGFSNIFVRDLATNTTVYASRASGADGLYATGYSHQPSISGDGRFVAFESASPGLSADDGNASVDIFVRDLQTNATILASRATDGIAGDGDSYAPSLSADGRFVAFTSVADNLSGDDIDAFGNIFVRDLQTGVTTYASRAGAAADGDSAQPAISADGRFVAFRSNAPNLSADDDDAVRDVFARDLQANTTTLVSRGGGATGAAGNEESWDPAISADGRFVAFSSLANSLSGEDNDAFTNVFRRDVLGEPPAPVARLTPAPRNTTVDTTGPRLRASALTRANRSIGVSRRGRFTVFCGRYGEPVTGTCRVRKLAARPFVAAPGKRALARFRLPRAAFRALLKAGRLTMRATVVARDRSGNPTTARFRLTLKAPRASR